MSWEHSDKKGKTGSVTPLCASILRLCAPTLERLTWKNNDFSPVFPNNKAQLQSLGNDPSDIPRFPGLRFLDLANNVIFSDSASLESFLHAPLIVFVVHAKLTEKAIFRKRGYIPTLETFVWYGY
jgi:hypothetical protein